MGPYRSRVTSNQKNAKSLEKVRSFSVKVAALGLGVVGHRVKALGRGQPSEMAERARVEEKP